MIDTCGTPAVGGMRTSALQAAVLVVGLFSGTSTSQSQVPSWGNLVAGDPGHVSTADPGTGAKGSLATSSPGVHPQEYGRRLVVELRMASGLTWEQTSRLLGVTQRTLHFWASGKAISANHEERLVRVLATVRRVHRGSAGATRQALLSITPENELPFDLLAAGRFAEVEALLGVGKPRRTVVLPPLSAKERAARRPVPPAQAASTLHGKAHIDFDGGASQQDRRG